MTTAAKPLKLVFCGTPQFAVPTLEALLAAGHQIALAVSQPDRPVGREQQLTAPPAKQTALAAGIPVTQPENIRNNAEFQAQLQAIAPDAIVVVAYGRIIPPWMLALPRLGCINLHASLLPKYRGAAPIQWAIAIGDAFTGNTTMLLEEGLDTGPILLQKTMEIRPEQTSTELFPALAREGAPLVVETLAGLADGSIKPQPQNHEGATYAPLLKREDGHMDFAARSATELHNRWRGFQPWPGAFTALDGKKLIVHRMSVMHESEAQRLGDAAPGTVHIESYQFFVACAGNTWLELKEVQLEGKKRLNAAEFLRGNPLAADARLG
ncbi:MAG: methionyl-tRNA formyltransferase [Terracidiphilus sp.]